MHAGQELLRPLLAEAGANLGGKVVLGTVQGDLHDIGKNLVGMMCEGAGFEVIDLGFNLAPEKFIEAIKTHQPSIVGMSALLTTTMRAMGHSIKAMEEAGLRDKVKVMVGGAPVDADFAERIGADGYGHNAASGAEMAKAGRDVVIRYWPEMENDIITEEPGAGCDHRLQGSAERLGRDAAGATAPTNAFYGLRFASVAGPDEP